MYISKKDLELLKNMNNNLIKMNSQLIIMVSKLEHQKEETNKKNYERIKEKRKINKNYARSKKESEVK